MEIKNKKLGSKYSSYTGHTNTFSKVLLEGTLFERNTCLLCFKVDELFYEY